MTPCLFFFFNDTATTEIYTNLNTRSLHDALPILVKFILQNYSMVKKSKRGPAKVRSEEHTSELQSHSEISYAVFCLKKKEMRAWMSGRLLARQPFSRCWLWLADAGGFLLFFF